jgi:hypothetical protein
MTRFRSARRRLKNKTPRMQPRKKFAARTSPAMNHVRNRDDRAENCHRFRNDLQDNHRILPRMPAAAAPAMVFMLTAHRVWILAPSFSTLRVLTIFL